MLQKADARGSETERLRIFDFRFSIFDLDFQPMQSKIENRKSKIPSLLPAGLRWAGPLLAAGYGLGSRLHRALSRPRYAPLATLCIGNITVGGTGKTPATEYFARGLALRGRRPAVLLRGYKQQAGDEAVELRSALDGLRIPMFIGADRRASGAKAREQGCDVALLDDGFQHWRLARDLDIVLVDATAPFGGFHLVPWGRLREGPEALSRAGVVIITRADMIPAADLSELEKQVAHYAPRAALAKARHRPVALRECVKGGIRLGLELLKETPVFAASGLGNPRAFPRALSGLGAKVLGHSCYPDHFAYTPLELDSMISAAKKAGAKALVVTAKDSAKLEPLASVAAFPVWALIIQFDFLENGEAVWARVVEALAAGDKRVGLEPQMNTDKHR
jgi:tetraacyldisaccharide 4'-kinase